MDIKLSKESDKCCSAINNDWQTNNPTWFIFSSPPTPFFPPLADLRAERAGGDLHPLQPIQLHGFEPAEVAIGCPGKVKRSPVFGRWPGCFRVLQPAAELCGRPVPLPGEMPSGPWPSSGEPQEESGSGIGYCGTLPWNTGRVQPRVQRDVIPFRNSSQHMVRFVIIN